MGASIDIFTRQLYVQVLKTLRHNDHKKKLDCGIVKNENQ